MKGTRKSSFIVSLKGRSVRDTSQAKNTPRMVLTTVTAAAMTSEFTTAWKMSGSPRTLRMPAMLSAAVDPEGVAEDEQDRDGDHDHQDQDENRSSSSAMPNFAIGAGHGSGLLPERWPCRTSARPGR